MFKLNAKKIEKIKLTTTESSKEHYSTDSWVEINKEALLENYQMYLDLVGEGCSIMPVIKSNAYGHGMVVVARILEQYKTITMLGVFHLEEALTLRAHDIRSPIFILGYTRADKLRKDMMKRIVLTVFSLEHARELSARCRELGIQIPVHVKIDTGLNRLGVKKQDVLELCKYIEQEDVLQLDGVMTHFADAETPENSYTDRQLFNFQECLGDLEKAGVKLRHAHATASGGALTNSATRLTMVRMGIALYGVWPSPETKMLAQHSDKVPLLPLLPVLSWRARVVQVKNIPAGQAVGYGCTYKTKRATRMAIIPVGYADGLDRALSNRGEVLIHGVRCDIIGNICMNATMIDVTDIDEVESGDVATIIGRDGVSEITVDEIAKQTGTISYEVLTGINWGLPRVQ